MMSSRRSTAITPRPFHGAHSYATTRSQRLKENNDTSPRHNGANVENGSHLASTVLSKSLSIYKASPLFKLSFTKKVLKALDRKIGLHIQKVDMWGESEAGIWTQNLIKVNAVPVFGYQGKPSGVLVTVTTTSEYGDNGDVDQKEIFWGLFCKPTSENSVVNLPENVLDLPLVLVKGRLPLIQEILTFFTKQFDCTIEKFHLSPLELAWLGAMWSGYPANIPCRPLKLVYTTQEIAGIETVSMTIAAKNARDLWKCIHDEDSDDFLLSEVNTFNKSLEAHFEKYFQLNLATFTLKSVMVTSLYAESSGKIKIFSPRTSYRILAHILSVIQQEMNV